MTDGRARVNRVPADDATGPRATNPTLPPYDVLRAMAGQVMAEFGPDVCGADMVSALTSREFQDWLRLRERTAVTA